MFQAIVTKYHGPTNTRGSRIIARAAAGSRTFPWDHALNADQNHQRAADLYAKALGWDTPRHGPLIGGALPSGDGYCFVFAATPVVNWQERAA